MWVTAFIAIANYALSSAILQAADIHVAAATAGFSEVEHILAVHPEAANAIDKYGNHPLHYACLAGSRSIAALLLAKGADVNATNDEGETALYIAASVMQTESNQTSAVGAFDKKGVIEILLQHGADARMSNKEGRTALHAAAREGNLEIVQLLVSRKSDIDAVDRHGATALYLALRDGHSVVAQLLSRGGAKLDIFTASGLGEIDQVTSLVKMDVKLVTAKGFDGLTPLHLAALNGQKNVVEFLLAHGADPNAKTRGSLKPLHEAVRGHHEDIADVLRSHGAEP